MAKEDLVKALQDGHAQSKQGKKMSKGNAFLMLCIIALWMLVDFMSKTMVDQAGYKVGETFAGPFLGLFQCTLVHNTGGAWGIFAGNTNALGFFSVAVCIFLLFYLMFWAREVGIGQALGGALIIAGGFGNAIDRFMYGYVVDFIDVTFMDFPVFNIADIGVTCGLAILILAGFMQIRNEANSTIKENVRVAQEQAERERLARLAEIRRQREEDARERERIRKAQLEARAARREKEANMTQDEILAALPVVNGMDDNEDEDWGE